MRAFTELSIKSSGFYLALLNPLITIFAFYYGNVLKATHSYLGAIKGVASNGGDGLGYVFYHRTYNVVHCAKINTLITSICWKFLLQYVIALETRSKWLCRYVGSLSVVVVAVACG